MENGDKYDVDLEYKSTGKTTTIKIRITRAVFRTINITAIGGVGFALFEIAKRVLAWLMAAN